MDVRLHAQALRYGGADPDRSNGRVGQNLVVRREPAWNPTQINDFLARRLHLLMRRSQVRLVRVPGLAIVESILILKCENRASSRIVLSDTLK